MNRHVNSLAGRLSLRQPQRDSLEILARVADIIPLEKDRDVQSALEVIRSEYPNVTDFEREFPSLCFSLATGVGKTRLMGAFIAYLHLARGVRHFFVLAPNLTIYNKLIADFTPGNPKYVLQGIAEFANNPPEVITGDNYESGRGVRAHDLFGETGIHVNIFNISKINSEVRGGSAPRIKRLSEYIGQSYFDYLAGLNDLVLLMDESHRYRASAGVRAINELKPVIGLELTATPQVEAGQRGPERFKNIIYDYPLVRALSDGFVKEPAVATRENFNAADYTSDQLERLKLEDGVRIHEDTKVGLEVYARQNDKPLVKPFMLIVARDTEHANALESLIREDTFFEGRYKNRVITVHSNQRGEERDETVERLLSVENPDEPTEIVIHVNMLKEGWDVTNLYTIVPLRAASSRTLVEQSIGRGLRLPYGKRVGASAVDRLTIVAHDRFQEIVDEANRPDSAIRVVPVYIGRDVATAERQVVTVDPLLVTELAQSPSGAPAAQPGGNGTGPAGDGASPGAAARPEGAAVAAGAGVGGGARQPDLVFATPAERQVARAALEAIRTMESLPRSADLRAPEVQQEIVRKVSEAVAPSQLGLAEVAEQPNIPEIVARTAEVFIERTIDIPRIVVQPVGEVTYGYDDFDLDATGINYQPMERSILIQNLRTNARERLDSSDNLICEARPEDYIVRALIDYDDVSYDDHADLLYKLAGQVVARLRSYLPDEDAVENVLIAHQQRLAEFVHAQMQAHHWERAADYETRVSRGFQTLRPNSYTAPAGQQPRNFREPVDDRQYIRGMIFEGFRRCLYPMQKFDSDPERRFAVLLENEADDGLKWFKPAKGQLQIYYRNDQSYEPDFVVETSDAKYLCEVKRRSDIETQEVQDKARAAVKWCADATAHELAHGGKPWTYLLIPHDEVEDNRTLRGLAATFIMSAR